MLPKSSGPKRHLISQRVAFDNRASISFSQNSQSATGSPFWKLRFSARKYAAFSIIVLRAVSDTLATFFREPCGRVVFFFAAFLMAFFATFFATFLAPFFTAFPAVLLATFAVAFFVAVLLALLDVFLDRLFAGIVWLLFVQSCETATGIVYVRFDSLMSEEGARHMMLQVLCSNIYANKKTLSG